MKRGFTIVELLIVIVVIAILAAITVVAYNGIRQRATNTSIISAASQVLKLTTAYTSTNSLYPGTSGGCVVLNQGSAGCSSGVANNNGLYGAVVNNLKTLGSVPDSVPTATSNFNGILYIYDAARTMQGQAAPVLLIYYLQGDAVSCGGIGNLADGVGSTLNKATNSYTSYGSGATACAISVSGPAA